MKGWLVSDSWCRPVKVKSGFMVYGGAARNVRIAASGAPGGGLSCLEITNYTAKSTEIVMTIGSARANPSVNQMPCYLER
jgi:hypothetical protein